MNAIAGNRSVGRAVPRRIAFPKQRHIRRARSALTVLATGLALWLAGCATKPGPYHPGGDSVLLFSFFRDNGQDGLYLAWSEDGLKWEELKPPGKSFLEPKVGGKLMRDPSLALGPDGTFRLVWTTGWGQPPALGYASSRDLVHWSEPRAVPAFPAGPTPENVWAPELFYDAPNHTWLIFWSSTIPGRFPETASAGDHNHRIYLTTTRDFETFTPTRLYFEGGFNVIDATLLQARGRYQLIVKDETKTPVKKHLRIATASSPYGPFGPAGAPFTTNWVEGPSAIEIGREVVVYFDHYAKPQFYGALKSADLARWEDVSPQLVVPSGMRHGTVLQVPRAIVERLRNSPRAEAPRNDER